MALYKYVYDYDYDYDRQTDRQTASSRKGPAYTSRGLTNAINIYSKKYLNHTRKYSEEA